MQDFRITPSSLKYYAYSYYSKKITGRTILKLCKRTAKFIDKLKPCKYSLTNRELKKQIFSNLEHTNQIERATEIPLRLIIFPAITISDITIFESLPSNGTVTVFRTIRPEFCPPQVSNTDESTSQPLRSPQRVTIPVLEWINQWERTYERAEHPRWRWTWHFPRRTSVVVLLVNCDKFCSKERDKY